MAILQKTWKQILTEKLLSPAVKARVFQLTRKLYEPEKPLIKLRPAYSVKLVLSYVVKAIEIKITAKFRDTEHLRFEDTKRIMSPIKVSGLSRNGPKGRIQDFQRVADTNQIDLIYILNWPTFAPKYCKD